MAAEAGGGRAGPTTGRLSVLVIWSPRALREVAKATAYLMDFNPRAAMVLAAGLVEAGDSLSHFPHRGRPIPNTTMRELVTAYPDSIRYRILRQKEVRILRVRHMARRPTKRT